MYEGYISCPVVVQPFVMPHVRHVCVILFPVMPNVRHAHLGLHIVVSLKGRTTCIWSFNFGFAHATTVRDFGFKLSFSIIIFL